MRQVRRNVFETNSSSTHSLTIMMKSDYQRWEKENLYLFDGYVHEWKLDCPVKGYLYTRDDAVAFAKKNQWYDNEEEFDDSVLKSFGFFAWDDEGSEYLESFYEEFTTPSGETIVAFGEYGYDG